MIFRQSFTLIGSFLFFGILSSLLSPIQGWSNTLVYNESERPGMSPQSTTDRVEPRRPNIVFIFTDDHAVQAISAYGSKINQTPRIDQLASQGIIFDRSYCGNSICGPSRASILTGKHSHRNGFMRNGDLFLGEQVTFPKLLQQAGYQTAMIGKWHLESTPTGFDHWEILPDQGSYYNPDFIQSDGSRKRFEGYCTDLIGDKSLEWLQSRSDDRPFLLMCQHKAPHRNWSPHPRHFGRYRMGTIPEPDTLFDDYSGRTKLLHESEMSIAKHFYWGHDMKFRGPREFPEHFLDGINNGEYGRMTPSQKEAWDTYYEPENQAFLQQLREGKLSDEEVVRWKYQRYLHDYLGCVEAVDENVGRILDYLDESGLTDNTIVVYASDQGFYLGEHGWYDKRWMFEESFRMPLVIRWPGVIKPNLRSQALVQNIDYAPTFLAAAGVQPPADMQGASLMPLLSNPGLTPADWRDAIYYAFYEDTGVHKVAAHDGIRTAQHKLIYFPKTDEWNAFDLIADPQELTSRHADPAFSDQMAELKQTYFETRQKYQVHSALVPQSREEESWWLERFQNKLAQAQTQDRIELVFLGDSITQGWEGAGKKVWNESFAGQKTLNLGFSGDRTEHLIWRLRRNSLQGKLPQAAVMMIGTNNTGHKMQAPEEVAAGIRESISLIQLMSPETKILLLGIFPRGETPADPGRLNNAAINDLIRQLHDGKNLIYLDLTDSLVQPDGTILKEVMPDFLHLSEEGYRRWAEAIVPVLKNWQRL